MKTVALIVGLMSLALLGLIGIQLYLLDHAMELKKQAFRQNVNAALTGIVQQLETREVATKVLDVTVQRTPSQSRMAIFGMRAGVENPQWADSLFFTEKIVLKKPQVRIDSNKIWYSLPTPQHVRLVLLDSTGHHEIHVVDEFKSAGKHELALKQSPFKKGVFFVSFATDSTSFVTKIRGGQNSGMTFAAMPNEQRQRIMRKVLDDISQPRLLPIEERIAPATLDSLLHSTLQAKGITTAYAYGVFSMPHDSLYFAKPAQFTDELKSSEFRSRLFPADIFAGRDELVLFFPQQNIYLLKQMVGLLTSSFVLLGIVVCGFVYTVRTIYKQKQFAGAMADFINNMTHEFKTPISTIALASEALANAEIAKDENRLQRYNRIIRDENTRMRNQVEKILEMAALEEGDYELNLAPVDAHKIITEAANSIAVQIESRGGKLERRLEASEPILEADEIHLTNVIHNLLDNANKYSPAAPQITISTANAKEGLHIRVADQGIGLRPEDQKRIFEKYYRVSTGNVHEVKGFGLGLSYVKLLVEAHGGTISVQSEYQNGAAFDILLPLRQRVNGNG